MDVVNQRAAGMDISKRDVKVAVRKTDKRAGTYTSTVLTFGAKTKPGSTDVPSAADHFQRSGAVSFSGTGSRPASLPGSFHGVFLLAPVG